MVQTVSIKPVSATIHGVVVAADTGAPLAGAHVTIYQKPVPPDPKNPNALTTIVIRTRGGDGHEPAEAGSLAITDDRGQFEFKDLAADSYSFSADRHGYESEYIEYTRVDEGQTVRGVVIRMTPIAAGTGNVSGYIRDDSGRPVPLVQVQLVRREIDSNGNPTIIENATAETNDLGEYRMYGVEPGRYFVVCSPNFEFWNGNRNAVRPVFPVSYYPGVAGIDKASTIEVRSATETSGIDLQIQRTGLYRIRGRIIDSSTGKPPAQANLNISGISPSGIDVSATFYKAADGSFASPSLPPGIYSLEADNKVDDAGANAVITLGNSDFEGLVLTLARSTSVTSESSASSVAGRISVDGELPKNATLNSIEGTVVRIGTNDPVPNTRVELIRVDAPVDRDHPQEILEMTTSLDGKFFFKEADAGSYRLRATSIGYVGQEYSQGTPAALLKLASGKTMKDVVFGLTATGSVSGRIRADNGEPLSGIPVTLLQYNYNSAGRRTLQRVSVSQKDQTDDRGEYRLFFVTPGKYLLYAGMPSPEILTERDEILESYSHVFFPGVPDPDQATAIVVQSGVELSRMDLTLNPKPVYGVRGRIVDSITGKAPGDADIHLTYGDPSWSFGYGIEYIGGEKASYQSGVFEFRNVIPGTFLVTAVVDGTKSWRKASATVQVANADVNGVVVTLPGNPAALSGRLTVEGKPYAFSRRVVEIVRAGGEQGILPTPERPAIDANGRFRFENVSPGDYRVSASSEDGYYIKEARFGGLDVLNAPMHFTGNESVPLEIVMSSNVAAVEGRVINEKRQPAVNAAVVLVPDRNRDRTELFRKASTDANGHFSISSIAPGDYRLFAWETLEPYEYFDPDLLARSESKALPVHLSELSKQNVEMRVIVSAP